MGRNPQPDRTPSPHGTTQDIETVDALIDAVNAFQGGIIVVSHDQHFIQNTCQEMWVVDKKRGTGLERIDGSFEHYKKRVLKNSTVC